MKTTTFTRLNSYANRLAPQLVNLTQAAGRIDAPPVMSSLFALAQLCERRAAFYARCDEDCLALEYSDLANSIRCALQRLDCEL